NLEPKRTLHQLRRASKESKKLKLITMADNALLQNPPANQALVNANAAEPAPLIRELGRHRNNRPICIVLPTIANNAEI
ncbi:hypothetical protein, partial [Pseudomonas aeruginosa]|uniref:hypothetical protein n=1 Tax=Pseudomonas aeruginosa TaxID=287 RepID=UPI00307EE9E2